MKRENADGSRNVQKTMALVRFFLVSVDMSLYPYHFLQFYGVE